MGTLREEVERVWRWWDEGRGESGGMDHRCGEGGKEEGVRPGVVGSSITPNTGPKFEQVLPLQSPLVRHKPEQPEQPLHIFMTTSTTPPSPLYLSFRHQPPPSSHCVPTFRRSSLLSPISSLGYIRPYCHSNTRHS